MKKTTLFTVCVLAFCIFISVVCYAAPPTTDYVLLLDEEFEGDALNTDLWAYRTGSTNRNENVRVTGGKLYIDYKKIDDNKTASSYTGGGVITKIPLPYGYYEVKAKTYNGARGLHTSFWTAAHNAKAPYYPQDNRFLEIDGFEFDSKDQGTAPTGYYNLHHWWADHASYGSKAYDIDSDGDKTNSDEFVIGFEYLPGKIVYYCNGVKVGETANTIYAAENVWLTALAWTDAVSPSVINDAMADANGLFGSSEFDYFKFYQKKLKGVNLLTNGHMEFSKLDNINSVPRGYHKTGSVIAHKTPFAHSGVCAASVTEGSTMGQSFSYLASGNYTFEGYFKAQANAVARLVVYDKNGNELKSTPINADLEWTKVSIADIAITDSAYAVVEVTTGLVMADDLAFYAQEGETGYESYKDTDYERYTVIPKADSLGTTLSIDSAQKSDTDWGTSTLAGVNNYYCYAYKSSLIASLKGHSNNIYSNINATWETTLEKDGSFDVHVKTVLYEDNIDAQYYTVKLDDTIVLDKIAVTTKASTTASQQNTIGTITGKAGQKVTITMTVPTPASNGDNVRITPISIINHDDLLTETAFVAQVNNPIYQYNGDPHAFDVKNASLTPYTADGTLYIPYQAIKSIVSVSGAEDNATYVTAEHIRNSSAYNVYTDNNHIIIYEKKYTPSSNFNTNTLTSFRQFSDRLLFENREPEYVGTAAASYQELWDINTVTLNAGWGNSSLGYGSNSRYNGKTDATAEWQLNSKKLGLYSVQFYNVVHDGTGSSPSTKNAIGTLNVNGKIYDYAFDQCNGQTGWFDLGTFVLDPKNTAYFTLTNGAASGILRANAMRLVPVYGTTEYFNNTDKDNQEYYDVSQATQTGEWTDAGDTHAGFKVSESLDASATFTLTPKKALEYRLQIYAPQKTSDATNGAQVQLFVNGQLKNQFLLDQKTQTNAGWYTLAVGSYTETDSITVALSNIAGNGKLYAKGIRLIPAFETPVFVNDKDALYQEYYGPNAAEKTGNWQYSTGVYAGCITTPDSDASNKWNVSPSKNTTYSIQVYVPKYTASGPTSAAALLDINGNPTYFTLYQRADSAENTGNGWYDLGTYNLTTADAVSLTISNHSKDGWLRAKAIRLVPKRAPLTLSNTQTPLYKEIFGRDAGTKVGEWIYSSGEYTGCIASDSAGAAVSWDIVPKADDNYEIEIYLPKFTENATDSAEIELSINGQSAQYMTSLKADSDGAGWYTLGNYNLKTTDKVTLTMTNRTTGWLRAKEVRIVPEKPTAVLVGNTTLPDQEYYDYSKATQTGKWSGSSVAGGSYYGSDLDGTPATLTWNITPQKAHSYSIQVYVPCMDQTSTTNAGYATLTVGGASHTFKLNQRKETEAYSGWYELDTMYLSPEDVLTIKMGKTSGTYIRAKGIRLVPVVNTTSVKYEANDFIVKANEAESYYNNIRFVDENNNPITNATLLDALVAIDKQADIGLVPNLTLSDGTPSTLTVASMAISPDTYKSQNLALTPGAGASYSELWSGSETFVDSNKTVTMEVNVPTDGTYHLVLSGNHWDTGRSIKANVDGTSFYSSGTNTAFILGGEQKTGVYRAQSENGISLTAGYHKLSLTISGTTRLNYAGLVKANNQTEAEAVQATFTTKEAFNAYMNRPVFDGTTLKDFKVAVNGETVTDHLDRYILSEGDEISLTLFAPISILTRYNSISGNITYDGNRQLSDETFAKTNFIILLNKGSFTDFPVNTNIKDSMRGLYINGYVGFNQDNPNTSGDETKVYNYIQAEIVGNSIDTSGRLIIALNLPANTTTKLDDKTFINLNGALSEDHFRNYGGYDFTNLYITDRRYNGDATVSAEYKDGKVIISSKKAQPIFVTVKNADGTKASSANYALNFNAPVEIPVTAGQTVYVWGGTPYIASGTTAKPLCAPIVAE